MGRRLYYVTIKVLISAKLSYYPFFNRIYFETMKSVKHGIRVGWEAELQNYIKSCLKLKDKK